MTTSITTSHTMHNAKGIEISSRETEAHGEPLYVINIRILAQDGQDAHLTIFGLVPLSITQTKRG